MPNTDREHLKALVGGLDLWHQFGAELPVDKAYKDAKQHIETSTPDTGGVEGPYRAGDKLVWHRASGTGTIWLSLTDNEADLANAAYSEGHKAGASGSDGLREAAKKVVADASEIAFGVREVTGKLIDDLAAALSDGGMGDE